MYESHYQKSFRLIWFEGEKIAKGELIRVGFDVVADKYEKVLFAVRTRYSGH